MPESTTPHRGRSHHGIAISFPVPTTVNGTGNHPINGHERTIAQRLPSDIECTRAPSPSSTPIDRSNPSVGYCDCTRPGAPDNPLCEAQPRRWRPADVLQVTQQGLPGPCATWRSPGGWAHQGVVGSICAKRAWRTMTASTTGTAWAVAAIRDSLPQYAQRRWSGAPACRSVAPGERPRATRAANVAEAGVKPSPQTCYLHRGGRAAPRPAADAVRPAAGDHEQDPLDGDRAVELLRRDRADLGRRSDLPPDRRRSRGTRTAGSYIDASTTPPVGNPALVAECPSVKRKTAACSASWAPGSGACVAGVWPCSSPATDAPSTRRPSTTPAPAPLLHGVTDQAPTRLLQSEPSQRAPPRGASCQVGCQRPIPWARGLSPRAPHLARSGPRIRLRLEQVPPPYTASPPNHRSTLRYALLGLVTLTGCATALHPQHGRRVTTTVEPASLPASVSATGTPSRTRTWPRSSSSPRRPTTRTAATSIRRTTSTTPASRRT